MKKMGKILLVLAAAAGLWILPCGMRAAEATDAAETTGAAETAEDKSDMIADADDRITVDEVGWEGMEAVRGEDLADGVYTGIEVESSSAMFRIINCDLTVAEGEITAEVTLSGKGYSLLFMGTGAEAVELDETAYASYIKNAEGKYVFQVPVQALDAKLECTSWSVRKEKWYDHQVVFRSDNLPDEAFLNGRPVRPTQTEESKKSKLVIAGQTEENTEESGE